MKHFFLYTFLLAFSAFGALAQTGIKGKVRADNERGLAGVSVSARQDGKEIKSTSTDSKGNFEMELAAGTYNIAFEKDGYAGGVLYKVKIKEGSIRDLGDRLVLMVDRATQVIIEGSIFNQEGFSLAGAKVEIARIGSDGSLQKLKTVFSSEDGEFVFKFPGQSSKFRITATFPKADAASKDIEVDGAGIYRTAISINPRKD